MGVNLSPHFLAPDYGAAVMPLHEAGMREGVSSQEKQRLLDQMKSIPRPRLDWVARHILHAINVGGEDCIGFGGDLDGMAQTLAGLETVADYVKFLPLLREAGLSEKQIEKICHGNFLRLFSELLPTAQLISAQ